MSEAMHVVSMREFEQNASGVWERTLAMASQGMQEPLRTASHLAFCRNVDPYSMPMDSCGRADAMFAICTVTVKDLAGPTPDEEWTPHCEGAVR